MRHWVLSPLILLVLAGCSAQLGRDFSATAITANIKVGHATTGDVLKLLGEPQGIGKAHLPPLGLVDLWEYHFAVASGGDLQQKMLFVFFDDAKKVQGYLWYSSLGIEKAR